MKPMRIFYSHHCWKYNTPMEEFEMELIRDGTPVDDVVVVNPRVSLPQGAPESVILEAAYELIKSCDALVFSTVSGVIGHGVFNEVLCALNNKKPVYEIIGTEIYEIASTYHFNSLISQFIFDGDNRKYAVLRDPHELDCL